ncbi:N-acetylmuramic acid 6-phosphate etherase [bacterium]|nr:N-acetylmuramic acid 6-phosphate etherase [bacterium]
MNVPSEKLAYLLTEQLNPHTENIDLLSSRDIVDLMHAEDYNAFQAVDSELDSIATAVDLIVDAFQNNGRLIYVGAGTSGRLGVLDAAECPPTFSSHPEMVQGIIAGGWEALRRSIENAEDSAENGAQAIHEKDVGPLDVVAGIAASSTTPYVVHAIKEAHRLGAKTVFITCNPGTPIEEADVQITLLVGPEVVAGSTRLKAGTATKLVLNMLTTASMIRIGKVYRNLMVDLNATCNKLIERSRRIIQGFAHLTPEETDTLLEKAHGNVKTALIMHFRGISREEALDLLAEHQGRIQDIIPREQMEFTDPV